MRILIHLNVSMLRCAAACALEPGVVGLVEDVDNDVVFHAHALDGGQRVHPAHQVDPVLRPLLRAPCALLREQDLRRAPAARQAPRPLPPDHARCNACTHWARVMGSHLWLIHSPAAACYDARISGPAC